MTDTRICIYCFQPKAATEFFSPSGPEGLTRWVSEPERPVDVDTAMKEVQRRKTADKGRWEREEGSDGGVYDGPTFRTRNVYTGAIVIGHIL